jgi:hypothetical protein
MHYTYFSREDKNMTDMFEVQKLMEKILSVLHENRNLLVFPKTSGLSNKVINVENLEDVAGNHLFDDFYRYFEITQKEGHYIRAFFQEGAVKNNYDFVQNLHNRFKNLLEPERQEYLDRINKIRSEKGLGLIML